MSSWGKTDELTSTPKYLQNSNSVYFVDTTEASIEENREKGIKTPGWTLYKTYTDALGNTRHKSEVLVVMKVSASGAGDAGTSGDTVVEDTVVADS